MPTTASVEIDKRRANGDEGDHQTKSRDFHSLYLTTGHEVKREEVETRRRNKKRMKEETRIKLGYSRYSA